MFSSGQGKRIIDYSTEVEGSGYAHFTMNEEKIQSPIPLESDLIVSDDSRAVVRPDEGRPEKDRESPEKTAVDSVSSALASDDLLPHPSTEAPSDLPAPSGRLPEPDSSNAPISPLTPEIFASGALPAGTMLGHFVIKSFIGGGGMGRVYLATDTALDRKVAVKVLPRQRANDQGTVARFMNEAKSAARLNHEHIAQVYFAGEQAGIPYIVFEYVEGTNIRTMVNDFDAFPLPQALNYLIQVSHALAHAAEHGVIHRDVKPSNILITREGRAKLIDMGLARLLDPSESQDDLTASGVTLGTFDYISPEQARDPRSADIRSDIYSLGCTFFFMLSGRPPFPEGTVLQKLLQHQGDEPPDVRAFQPNIPAEVALLIQKMMAKDPRQRFQTPAALIDALVNVAKMLGLQPTGPGKLVWVMTPPSRTSIFLKHIPWGLAVVSLFVAFFLMNLYSEQREPLPLPPEPVVQIMPIPIDGPSETLPVKPPPSSSEMQRAETVRPPFRVESYPSSKYDIPFLSAFSLFSGDLAGTGVRVANRAGHEREGRGLGPSVLSAEKIGPSKNGQTSSASLGMLDVFRHSGSEPNVSSSETIASEPLGLCVDPSGETPGSYPTLAAALVDAGKHATIELRWNNVQSIEPIVLSERRLTFIAAEGYYPVLQFKPSGPKNMFTLTDCELEFRNLALDMRIHHSILAENWSMFGLSGANRIDVTRCCLTIRNKSLSDNSANHDDVTFIRNGTGTGTMDTISLSSPVSQYENPLESPSGSTDTDSTASSAESVSMSPLQDEARRLKINFVDSVVRGEATVLLCDIPQPVELLARNTLFALAMPFVRTEDTRRTKRQESSVAIGFDRVTFFGRQAFAYQIQRSHETHPMLLDITARHSIFFLNNVSLAVFRGAPSSQGAYDYFHWSGRSNYFQSVSFGWRFRADPSRSSGGIDYNMSLDQWKNTMNREAETDPALATKIDVLRFEEIRKPPHLLLPGDLSPYFLPEANATEKEKRTTGADLESLDWMPRSWTGEE